MPASKALSPRLPGAIASHLDDGNFNAGTCYDLESDRRHSRYAWRRPGVTG